MIAAGALARLAALGASLNAAAAEDPIRHMRWTPPQDSWLRLCPKHRVKLLRGGNQAIGKTTAGLAEVDWRATGRHPYRKTRVPPVEIWVVCTSWAQSVAIQRKFWAIVSRSSLTPFSRDQFSHRRGWGKDNPVVEYLNGSIVRFRTTGQGPEAFAGASIDYALVDEPTEEEIFRELLKRVLRTGGEIGIVLTPVNRDCAWLHKLVDDGVVEEVHAKLTVANLTPIGDRRPLQLLDGTPMDQAWIDEQWKVTPALWAPVVLDGEWETRPEGVFFKCFDAVKHVSGRVKLDAKRGRIFRVLGIDYAAADRQYGHVAVLADVLQWRDEKGRAGETVLVRDEVAVSGVASDELFARELVTMLERQGLRWRDLDHVFGDNPVTSSWVEKSNLNTTRALARELNIPISAVQPRLFNAKEGTRSAGSKDTGNRYIYDRIASGHLVVHPRCSVLIKGLATWDYSNDHPLKDVVDALRYSLRNFVFSYGRSSNAKVHLYGGAAA